MYRRWGSNRPRDTRKLEANLKSVGQVQNNRGKKQSVQNPIACSGARPDRTRKHANEGAKEHDAKHKYADKKVKRLCLDPDQFLLLAPLSVEL